MPRRCMDNIKTDLKQDQKWTEPAWDCVQFQYLRSYIFIL
jgi:hypothetical protein